MFRSIFSKLIVIFISILLIGFTITGIMLYYLLSNFVTSDKVDTLSKSGDEIKSYIVNVYFQDQNNAVYVKHLKDILYSYSVNTKSFIWVVNKSGYIMAYEPTKPDTDAFMERLKDNNGSIHLPDEKQYKDVMNADKTIIKTGGDFYGLFKDTGVSWLTVEKPLIYKGSVVGAVYLHTQIPEVNKLSKSVLRLFLASVAISVFISIIFIYLFSLRISKPLKEINNAARIIAGGKFQQRLN
ncbi:MAG TPA: two-component sensor histidine kinase, partial [Clostridia bacterium]